MIDVTVNNNPAQHRYDAFIDGALAGYCEYNLLEGAIMFTHTEVLPEREGLGVASALARHVLDAARAQGLQVIPACPFVAGWIHKHHEYADLVRPDVQRAFKI